MASGKKQDRRSRSSMPGKAGTPPGATHGAGAAAQKKAAGYGMIWPNIPSPMQAVPLALQFSFQVSEWWSAERLLENQLRQISALLIHAVNSVPYYKEKLRHHTIPPPPYMTMADFQQLPLLRRADIQSAGKELASRAVPVSHGKPFEIRSSGSTGRPIRVLGTGLTGIYVRALTIRGHLWHGRDLTAKNVDIRTARTKEDSKKKHSWSPVPDGGESVRLDINLPIHVLLEQLIREDPTYLQTHPYTLKGLIENSVERGVQLKNLREVRTFGEALDQGIRDAARTHWGVEVIDNYSAMEMGTMAHQCPENENLHVQSESVLVEVLGDDDKPCSPGEAGRVVVTALHNFATPLIRYEIGDYAEVGETCACGRGLPVLKRILGRERNFLVLPSGEKRFPEAWKALTDIAPEIRQFQLIQKSVDEILLKLVVASPLAHTQESQLTSYLTEKFGHKFNFRFQYVDEIPRGANGKFEEFKSEVL
jgi:phenylacetate-CoA ligase